MIRALQLADLECAVRALRAVPPAQRGARLAQLLAQAHCGAAYFADHRRPHPDCGTGTLMSVALRQTLAPRPPVWGRDDLICLAQIARAIARDLRNNRAAG